MSGERATRTLQTLLALERPLLADGALATNLIALGEDPKPPFERWNVDHPAPVAALHRAYVKTGADIILTNTFGGNRRTLARYGLAARVHDLNRRGAALAREAADAADRPVLVAGSVGPLGIDRQAIDAADVQSVFAEQMEGLVAGGADVIWIETMSNAIELGAAVAAAAGFDRPYAVTASFHEGSSLDPQRLAALAGTLHPRPFAIGLNCGSGPTETLEPLTALRLASPDIPLIAKPNAGLPVLRDGVWHYPATVADFARFAGAATPARIVGGCCGTTPAHVEAMHRAMRNQNT